MSLGEELRRLLAGAPPSAISVLAQGCLSLERLVDLANNHPDLAARRTFKAIVQIEKEQSGAPYVAHGVAVTLHAVESPAESLVVSAPFETAARETAGVLASMISGAEHSILLCTFVLAYIDDLVPLLSAASSRGVSMKVVVDDACRQTAVGRHALDLMHLAVPDIDLRVWSGGDTTLHAKFVVVDSRVVWVSSANLTGRALVDNVEAGVLTESIPIVTAAERFFANIWDAEAASAIK